MRYCSHMVWQMREARITKRRLHFKHMMEKHWAAQRECERGASCPVQRSRVIQQKGASIAAVACCAGDVHYTSALLWVLKLKLKASCLCDMQFYRQNHLSDLHLICFESRSHHLSLAGLELATTSCRQSWL